MSNKIDRKENRLSKEKSPYLLQHAWNPVDWYPWGTEAFDKAARENRPVFLSIGYSTCHWCHVMEHESFEDDEVAALLNENFISIKVDREERPDIDNIYMSVCSIVTGSGGWPLTIIMTPDKKPFFAATYIPKEKKWGRPGLMEILPGISEVWKTRRVEAEQSAGGIIKLLERSNSAGGKGDIDKKIFEKACSDFKSIYDHDEGGFGRAPKFPSPHNLLFLLRYWRNFKEADALEMVSVTLRKMRLGGIFDQVGYGFHRYSTDSKWLVPHFEKMLYDQAMLAIAYAEAYQATKEELFAATCGEILEYVLRDMTSPEGGFYSAEDADSEGEEGKFYLWKSGELGYLLSKSDLDIAVKIFNIREEGNFRDAALQQPTGENILHLRTGLPEFASKNNMTVDELKGRLKNIRELLFSVREKRVHPLKDDKILTDWNGLMIAALAIAGRVFKNSGYIDAAVRAFDFIKKNMWQDGSRLLHRYRDGEAAIQANLDDYSFLAWGLIELYEAAFNAEYLDYAIRLSENIVAHFNHRAGGSFYFTPDDGEEQISRSILHYDSAIPSGNSIVFYNFMRLAGITGDTKWEERADKLSRHASGSINKIPSGHAMFLSGLDMAMNGSMEIVVAGNPDDPAVKEILSSINEHYLPGATLILNPGGDSLITHISPAVKSQVPVNGRATAYVCRNNTCSAPVNEIRDIMRLINEYRVPG